MHTKVLFRRRSGEVTIDSQSAGHRRSGPSGRGRLAGLGVAVLMLGGGVAAVSSASAAAATAVSVSPALSVATMSGVRQSKVIGYSVQGRAIVAYEIGNPKAPTKDLVLGSMHGYYERAGEQVVASLKAMAIPTNLDLWVIPTINPDGDAMGQRANAHNVDLNRDWPNNWVHIRGNPADKFDNHGNGSAPLSQPETRAMYDFLRWLRPVRVVSMHQPLDGVDTTDGGGLPQGRAFRDALAANLGLPLKALTCFGGCHGSMTGWLTNYTSTVGITVEFGSSESSSYLQGQTARGIVSALGVGVKAWSAPTPVVPTVIGVLDKAVVSPGAIPGAGLVSGSGPQVPVIVGHGAGRRPHDQPCPGQQRPRRREPNDARRRPARFHRVGEDHPWAAQSVRHRQHVRVQHLQGGDADPRLQGGHRPAGSA